MVNFRFFAVFSRVVRNTVKNIFPQHPSVSPYSSKLYPVIFTATKPAIPRRVALGGRRKPAVPCRCANSIKRLLVRTFAPLSYDYISAWIIEKCLHMNALFAFILVFPDTGRKSAFILRIGLTVVSFSSHGTNHVVVYRLFCCCRRVTTNNFSGQFDVNSRRPKSFIYPLYLVIVFFTYCLWWVRYYCNCRHCSVAHYV